MSLEQKSDRELNREYTDLAQRIAEEEEVIDRLMKNKNNFKAVVYSIGVKLELMSERGRVRAEMVRRRSNSPLSQ